MPACLSRPGDAPMPRALAMSACLSCPDDARMPLAPWRCPHASRPGDVRMSLAPWRCPHASRPGDVRILSRPGDARMPRALAMSDLWWYYYRHTGSIVYKCNEDDKEANLDLEDDDSNQEKKATSLGLHSHKVWILDGTYRWKPKCGSKENGESQHPRLHIPGPDYMQSNHKVRDFKPLQDSKLVSPSLPHATTKPLQDSKLCAQQEIGEKRNSTVNARRKQEIQQQTNHERRT
ncbi:hypothetical protein VNO80_19219 [Phaseolus coccineus]|uniref:Uncharacterized protein n=1 Tax=Phaseolus coccineus TaxID=3886 RepID=A0AAN9MKS5_PHACN